MSQLALVGLTQIGPFSNCAHCTVNLGLESAGVVEVLVLRKHLLGDVHLDDLPQLEVLLGQPEHVVTGLLGRRVAVEASAVKSIK